MKIERIKEALEQAKGGLEWYNKNHPEMKEQIKWQETIIWALEKQVTKKVLNIENVFDAKVGNCPNCNELINNMDNENFCGKCGQALDWSDDND